MGPKKRGVKKVENTPKNQKSKSAGCGKPKSSPNTKLNLSELQFACSDLHYELNGNDEFTTIQQKTKQPAFKAFTHELGLNQINTGKWFTIFQFKTSNYVSSIS